MIHKVEIKKQYIEDQEEFLKSLQTAVKDGLMAPLGLILDDTPEIKRRMNAIIDTIRNKFNDVDVTLVLPGTLLQFIFFKKELLVTVLFMENKKTGDRAIHLELCKLSSEDINSGK